MDPRPVGRRGPNEGLPRTRGDGPGPVLLGQASEEASPHTRGWTLMRMATVEGRLGFPAHAGMDPAPTSSGGKLGGLPRTRGDGPITKGLEETASVASPHTRGWTWWTPF